MAGALAAGQLVSTPAAGPAQATGTVKLTGYGADSCTAPSESQMSAFWRNTPYSDWGIYFGGSDRGCSQPNLTRTWVSDMLKMGWDLLPIWVGPQNPCTAGQSSYFSRNATTARSQGVAQAKAAYQAWSALSSVSNVPFDYDMEAPSSDSATCRTAAKAFLDGWVAQLHVAPAQVAGVYSSSCGGYLDDFATIAHRPDFIDAADWDGSPSTGGISCVASNHWTLNQRHKQYQGGHNATYNGVTLNIDSRCSDAAVFGNASRTSTTQACARTAKSSSARAATSELATTQQPVTWRGTQWPTGSARAAKLLHVRSATVDGVAPASPAVGSATVGRPAALANGSLVVPVTEGTSEALYTTTDGKHFTRRSALPLAGPRNPGVLIPTAGLPDSRTMVVDPDARHAQVWSPAGTRRFAVRGLPGLPESLRFTSSRVGVAVVEAGGAGRGKTASPLPVLYRTSDGGHSWHLVH